MISPTARETNAVYHLSARQPGLSRVPDPPRPGPLWGAWLFVAACLLLVAGIGVEVLFYSTGGYHEDARGYHPDKRILALAGPSWLAIGCALVLVPLFASAARRQWAWRYGALVPAMVLPYDSGEGEFVLNGLFNMVRHVALGPLAMLMGAGSQLGRVALIYEENGRVRRTSYMAWTDSRGVLPVDDWEIVWMIRPTWICKAQVIRANPPQSANYLVIPDEVQDAAAGTISEAEQRRAAASGKKLGPSIAEMFKNARQPRDRDPGPLKMPVKRKPVR